MSMHCLYFLMYSHLSVLFTCIDSMSILSIFPNMFQYCMNFVIWRIVLGIQLLGEQFVNILHLTNLSHSAFGLLSLNMGQFMFLFLDPIHNIIEMHMLQGFRNLTYEGAQFSCMLCVVLLLFVACLAEVCACLWVDCVFSERCHFFGRVCALGPVSLCLLYKHMQFFCMFEKKNPDPLLQSLFVMCEQLCPQLGGLFFCGLSSFLCLKDWTFFYWCSLMSRRIKLLLRRSWKLFSWM